MIHFEKHAGDHAVHSMKETVEQRTILKKKIPKILSNRKNAVPVTDINEFKRHTGSAFHGILVATGRAKAAVTAERNKFKLAATGTAVHGTAERRIAAV